MKYVMSYKGNQINWIHECKNDEEAYVYLYLEEYDFETRELVDNLDELYKLMENVTGYEEYEDDRGNESWRFYEKSFPYIDEAIEESNKEELHSTLKEDAARIVQGIEKANISKDSNVKEEKTNEGSEKD